MIQTVNDSPKRNQLASNRYNTFYKPHKSPSTLTNKHAMRSESVDRFHFVKVARECPQTAVEAHRYFETTFDGRLSRLNLYVLEVAQQIDPFRNSLR